MNSSQHTTHGTLNILFTYLLNDTTRHGTARHVRYTSRHRDWTEIETELKHSILVTKWLSTSMLQSISPVKDSFSLITVRQNQTSSTKFISIYHKRFGAKTSRQNEMLLPIVERTQTCSLYTLRTFAQSSRDIVHQQTDCENDSLSTNTLSSVKKQYFMNSTSERRTNNVWTTCSQLAFRSQCFVEIQQYHESASVRLRIYGAIYILFLWLLLSL